MATLWRTTVLVLGAGVSGLTTAVCLAEAGVTVRVLTERPPGETTSFGAGALWGPYFVAHEHVARWSLDALREFEKIAEDEGSRSGVRLVTGFEADRAPVTPPPWTAQVSDFRLCGADELPGDFISGWSYTVPVIDMPAYLQYLEQRLRAAGGTLEVRRVATLRDLDARIVVNCSGYGAHDLVPDPDLVPVRGQLVVVDNPGIDWFFAEHSEASPDLTYFLPHRDHVVLGGTAEEGRTDLAPDDATSEAIVRRCAEVEPRLKDAQICDVRVGVRPTRSTVRVEHVAAGDRHVIHNYGHGGAGVTLSWGCAREVVALVGATGR